MDSVSRTAVQSDFMEEETDVMAIRFRDADGRRLVNYGEIQLGDSDHIGSILSTWTHRMCNTAGSQPRAFYHLRSEPKSSAQDIEASPEDSLPPGGHSALDDASESALTAWIIDPFDNAVPVSRQCRTRHVMEALRRPSIP
jgi:hypothetical protein